MTASTSASSVIDPFTSLLLEAFFAGLVVVFIINFIIGMRSNLSTARSIASTLRSALSEQFAHFGDNRGRILMRDGASYFWFYATGRVHTSGLLVAMDLAKRMDLFLYTSAIVSEPQKDRLTFYLPFAPDVRVEPFTLFLVKRKELVRLRASTDGRSSKAVKAVESMAAEVVDMPPIPLDFVIMTEHVDIPSALLPESICQLIARNTNCLLSVHVSDQAIEWDPQSAGPSRLIRIEIALPYSSEKHGQVLSDMSQLAMHLLDSVATLKLTAAARKRSTDLRRRAREEEEKREQRVRAEEAAARKVEKKKQEEEAVGKMSADKQRKYEEKKRKKEVAARMRKVTKR